MKLTPYEYMLIADRAYGPNPDIGDYKEACGIVRPTPDGLVIAFSGTDSIIDAIYDADIGTTQYMNLGRIHDGFLDYWRRLRSETFAATHGLPVTFVGHSLGAALALIAAADFDKHDLRVNGVYAFEPPRVSPDENIGLYLASAMPVNMFRTGLDIVTQLPPLWKQSGTLTPVGKPSYPFDNIADHMRPRVLDALRMTYGAGIDYS